MGKKLNQKCKSEIKFVQGLNKGIDKIKAEELFDEIEKFVAGDLIKAVAAYAMTYQTAFLKANYPLEFLCSLMNHEIGNFESIIDVL